MKDTKDSLTYHPIQSMVFELQQGLCYYFSRLKKTSGLSFGYFLQTNIGQSEAGLVTTTYLPPD